MATEKNGSSDPRQGPVRPSQDVWYRLRDSEFRRRLTYSACLCLCFFSVGLAAAQRGPAQLDLQQITDTDVQQASAFFTATAAGFMAGSLLSGLLYDLLRRHGNQTWTVLVLVLSMVMMGVAVVVTPFCWHFWLMVAVCFLVTAFGGSVATVSTADMLATWKESAGAALQALNFCFALGGVVAPLLTEPFLAPSVSAEATPNASGHSGNRSEPLTTVTELTVLHLSRDSIHGNSSPGFLFVNKEGRDLQANVTLAGEYLEGAGKISGTINWSPEPVRPSSGTRIHLAFISAASLVFLSALPLIVEYIRQNKRKAVPREQAKPGDGSDQTGQKADTEMNQPGHCRLALPFHVYLVTLLWACVFFFLYTGVEVALPSYMTTFMVMQMNWSKSQGAVLTTVFFVAFAAARFANIFLIKVFRPMKLLVVCFTFVIVSFLVFLVSSLWQQHWGMWVSALLGGVGMSAIFPAAITWIDGNTLAVSGRVTSAFLVFANAGPLVNPLILGHLMENEGAIWLAYILLGEATLYVLTFFLLVLFTKVHLQQKYHTLGRERNASADASAHAADSEKSTFL